MKSRPKYWRSLAELEGDPKFQEYVEREFRSPLEAEPLSSAGRRRFVQLMGASFALAGCRYQEEKVLPHSSRPEGMTPGVPQLFATTVDIAGVATGLLVKSFDGRPIKVDGNPDDSTSQGGTGTFHQASVLGLYDPERSSKVRQGKSVSSWKKYGQALSAAFASAAGAAGAGFAVLSTASSSPTLAALRGRLLETAPKARWVAYEATHSAGAAAGAKLAFGAEVTTLCSPEKADIIVALDSDLIAADAPGGLGYARAVASRRDADAEKMSRIYAFESLLTELGSLADHRVAVSPGRVLALLAYLDAKLSAARQIGGAQKAPSADALGGGDVQKVLDVAVRDLLDHGTRSLVTVGSKHGPEAHALVHRINHALGNVGTTVRYTASSDALAGGINELAALVADMAAGKVQTLLVLGGNPAYDAPVDLEFAAALAKVKTSFHLGLYDDETASLCSWHAPETHYLESWGDARAVDGTVRLAQPLLEPMLGGRSAIEVVAGLFGETGELSVQLRKQHGLDDDKAWRKAVHDGKTGKPAKEIRPELQNLTPVVLPKAQGLEIVFSADPAVFDGRFANNGWLQEMPHPLSKLTWGNAALVSPATAEKNGLSDGHLCTVTLDGRSVELPALISPGQADGTVGLCLGYGRQQAGVVGGSTARDVDPVGANTYAIRQSKAPHFAIGAKVTKTGPRQELAITQDLWAIDAVGKAGQHAREDVLVRETTLTEYDDFKKHSGDAHGEHGAHPGDIKGKVHHPPLLNLWDGPVSYDGHKWGMAVDLNKCSGCGACTLACQSENNISVVGKDEVAMGREMSWIRVERYYKGSKNAASVRQQPVMCQHCENAPCEQVCPVGATMHSPEGLNDMVYNRCIGTRYCSNNCPYKVRRFNYRSYNEEFYGMTPFTGTVDPKAKLKAMAFNPEVTVRSRGVMEKCTFCVQRIQNVKIKAKNEKRALVDGDISTACEDACPTGAIVFGDLNDKDSRVAAAAKRHRGYELLQELNNKPRVNYLARISNPHPDLSSTETHGDSSEPRRH